MSAANALYLATQNVSKTGGNYFAVEAEERAAYASFWTELGVEYAELAMEEDHGWGTLAATCLAYARHRSQQAWYYALLSTGAEGSQYAQDVMAEAQQAAELAETGRIAALACAD